VEDEIWHALDEEFLLRLFTRVFIVS
jgi:hypothetical protein